MPTTIKAEDFDGVTAPADPSGWSKDVSSGTQGTSTTNPRSGVNSYKGTGTTNYLMYWPTLDGNGGDQQVSMYFLPSLGGWVVARITSALFAGSYYFGVLGGSTGSNQARIFKKVAGVQTQLGSTVTPSPALVTTDWHYTQLVCSGTSISYYVRRLNGDYLTAAGGWSATPQACITVTDSAVSGQGYGGFMAGGNADQYGDDFLYESLASGGAVPVAGFRSLLGVGV